MLGVVAAVFAELSCEALFWDIDAPDIAQFLKHLLKHYLDEKGTHPIC